MAPSTTATLDHHWMPLTANRAFVQDPRILERAEGNYYWARDGTRLLDAASGLYCTPAGHGRVQIADAVHQQLRSLDYASSMQYGHESAFALSDRLVKLLPERLSHIFFVNSGSEAVDTALKAALRYHRVRGEGQRMRFVSRERAYHGMNIGGTLVSGIRANRLANTFGAAVSHIRHTLLERNRKVLGQPDYGADLAEDLSRHIDLHGGETIAACIVEPISGAGGVIVPPAGYLERLRHICDVNGILLIFDEVISGFGRTGKPFAAQSLGVIPDIMTMAKAITNGTIPMGAVAFSDDVHETILNGEANLWASEFSHGYTFSAHPVACAAGMAALDIYEAEGLFDRAAALSVPFLAVVRELADIPVVRDVRGYGLLAAIELSPVRDAAISIGFEALKESYRQCVLPRVSGNNIVLAPAFVYTEDALAEMAVTIRTTLLHLTERFYDQI